MLRPTILLIVVLLAGSALAGGSAAAKEPVFPPGSRIGLVPPDDMVLARGLTGFRNTTTGAAILAVEMPADAYPSLAAGFTEQGLRQQGFAETRRSVVEIAGGPAALLVTGQQVENGRSVPKSVLLTADPTFTALVIGQLPQGSSEAEIAAVETALRSVTLRPPLGLEQQIAALPFRLRDVAGFRPIRALAGNSLLLTEGPSDVIRVASQPVLIVAQSFGPAPPAAAREAFARQALTSNTFIRDAVLERSQGFRQGGSEWHEIVAKAKETSSGQDVVVMQTIRFEPDSYIRAVGMVRPESRDDILPRFRRVVDGLLPQ